MKKNITSVIIAIVMVLTTVITPAYAANTNESVQAVSDHDIVVTYKGVVQNFLDANGSYKYPVIYEGTTYLPIRGLSNTLGISVEWIQDAKTVILSDENDNACTITAPNIKGKSETVTATIDKEIKVVYNDKEQSMFDVNGVQVYPIVENGTVYLPVRGIANILSISIEWIQEQNRVKISEDEVEYIPAVKDTMNLLDNKYTIGSNKFSVDESANKIEFNSPANTIVGVVDDYFEVNTGDYEYIDFIISNNGNSTVYVTLSAVTPIYNVKVNPGATVNAIDACVPDNYDIRMYVWPHRDFEAPATDVTLSDLILHN